MRNAEPSRLHNKGNEEREWKKDRRKKRDYKRDGPCLRGTGTAATHAAECPSVAGPTGAAHKCNYMATGSGKCVGTGERGEKECFLREEMLSNVSAANSVILREQCHLELTLFPENDHLSSHKCICIKMTIIVPERLS